ncbi:MAG: hypothetical protein HYS12_27955 [Planctomycetes bacterium]|nr:hypothetical protein [Planctomycetota bacterium]
MCRVLVLALTAGLLGCTGERAARPVSWMERLRPFQADDKDVVQIEVALVEVPAGDRFLNGALWQFVDEQVVPLEKKAQLEENGFRVGQVGAKPPQELLELITQKRTCPAPRRFELHAGRGTCADSVPSPDSGSSRPLELGPPRAKTSFQLHQDEQSSAVELEQAACLLRIVPSLSEDGRTKLTCTPQLRHSGKGLMPWRPLADRSGWALQLQQPTETYAALGWEVSLAPGEFLVVGARFDRPATLGHEAFVRIDEPAPVQRLLFLRTARPGASLDLGLPSAASGGAPSRPPPLALQASWSSVRGACP